MLLSRGFDLNLFGGLPRIRLLEPGRRDPLLTFARAQLADVEASHYASDGTTLAFDAADVARFNGTAQRLLFEGQRTRLNILAADETMATQSVTVTAAAHTLSFWGTGSVALSGAATGSLAGTGAGNRVTLTFTPAAGTLTPTVTGTVSRAQLEAGSFASTYIRKQDVAATRGADLAIAALASLGIGGSGACTVLWSGTVAGVLVGNRRLFCIHDGTFANSVAALVTANSLVAIRTAGGTPANSSSAGTVSLDTRFAAGAVIGAGRVACSLNGGAVQAVTGAPTSGLTTLQVGSWLGAEALFGEIGLLGIIPRPVSDAQLQRLVAAMPL